MSFQGPSVYGPPEVDPFARIEPRDPLDAPIVSDFPAHQRRIANRYLPGGTVDQLGAAPHASRALAEIDLERVARGSRPLTEPVFTSGLLGAQGMSPQLPEPESASIWQNITSNVADIATGILPHRLLPALWAEARQIPDIPQHLEEARQRSDNVVEMLGLAAQAPALRLAPPAFVAGELLTDQQLDEDVPFGGRGWRGLREDPVFAALDVLPFAGTAARQTRTFKLARELENTRATQLGELPRHLRPLKTVMRYGRPGGPRVVQRQAEGVVPFEEGGRAARWSPDETRIYDALEPNRFGEKVIAAGERWRQTRVGGRLSEAFGRQSRELSRVFSRHQADIQRYFRHDESRAALASRDPLAGFAATIRSELDTPGTPQWKFREELTPERRAEIGDVARRGDPSEAQLLRGTEREFYDWTRFNADEFARRAVDEHLGLERVEIGGVPEFFDANSAHRIQRAQRANEAQVAMQYLRDAARHVNGDPAQIWQVTRTALQDRSLSRRSRQAILRSAVEVLDLHGYSGSRVMAMFTEGRRLNQMKSAEFNRRIAERLPERLPFEPTRARISPETFREPRVLANDLNPWVRRTPSAPRLQDHLRNGRHQAALNEVNNMRRLNDHPRALLDEIEGFVRYNRDSQRAVSRLEQHHFTDRMLRQSERARRSQESRPPARYFDLLHELRDWQLSELAVHRSSLDGSEIARAIEEGRWADLGFDRADVLRVNREVQRTWQELRDVMGYDPVYVHRVDPDRAARLMTTPQPFDHVPTLSWVKERTWESTPTVRDPLIAVNAQAMEVLVRRGAEGVVEGLRGSMALDGATLRQRLTPIARDHAQRHGLRFEDALQQVMKREGWAAWNPESFITGRDIPLSQLAPDQQLYLPRAVLNNIERMRPGVGDLGQLLDTPTRVFRTALLPLSPRWHLYNIVGNTTMMVLQAQNPITIWKYLGDAWRMAQEARVGGGLGTHQLASPTGEIATRGLYARGFEVLPHQARAYGLHHFAGGASLSRWTEAARSSRAAQAGQRLIEASYAWNNVFDNLARSMAFLEKRDTLLARMSSDDVARLRARGVDPQDYATLQGIAHARRVLQEWDTLTPLERSTMRFIFPFYSWTRTVLRYVYQYPADHPYRLSITSKLAQTELNDLQSGLPQRLQQLLFLGQPDEWGNVTTLNIEGSNPFRDVANYATLAGFLFGGGRGDLSAVTTNANPALGAFLTWLGVDTMRGQAELYPEFEYNPETGELETRARTNPVTGTVEQFIPQARLLTAAAGFNREYAELAESNPEAAGRAFLSSIGVPVVFRDLNIAREHAQAEMRRYHALQEARTEAMAEGDPGLLMQRYPDSPEAARIAMYIAAMQRSGQHTPFALRDDAPWRHTLRAATPPTQFRRESGLPTR